VNDFIVEALQTSGTWRFFDADVWDVSDESVVVLDVEELALESALLVGTLELVLLLVSTLELVLLLFDFLIDLFLRVGADFEGFGTIAH